MAGLGNQIKTLVLLAVLTGLLLFVGAFFGKVGLFIALIFSIAMNFGTYWFSDKIVLWMYGAKEINPNEHKEIRELVKDVCNKANLPMPKLYIIDSNQPNAFATGRNEKHSAIAFTKGILTLLDKEELKGVIAHELSHVKNKDILVTTIAATIAGVITYLARMAQFGVLFGGGRDNENGGNIISLLILVILTPIIAILIQLAISRSREYLADESGARILKNPDGLARALAKLEKGVKMNPLKKGSPATGSLF
ncbi:MAG: protease HtpX, partial [Nanoarchaeota archaeon]